MTETTIIPCIPGIPPEIAGRLITPWPDCILWNGATDRGYGRVWRDSDATTQRVHRVVYETVVGPVPDGMELDHKCRVKMCVNPEHLEPVTHRENMRRATPFLPGRKLPDARSRDIPDAGG